MKQFLLALLLLPSFAHGQSIVFTDNAEHQQCGDAIDANGNPTVWAGQVTCKDPIGNDIPGLLDISGDQASQGAYSLRCDWPDPTVTDNHQCKFNLTGNAALDLIDVQLNPAGGYACYLADIYLDDTVRQDGFQNDGSWKIFQQWKLSRESYSGQNPKINVGYDTTNGSLQVVLYQPGSVFGTTYNSGVIPNLDEWWTIQTCIYTHKTAGTVELWYKTEAETDFTRIVEITPTTEGGPVDTIEQELKPDGTGVSANTSLFYGVAHYTDSDTPSLSYFDNMRVSSEFIPSESSGQPVPSNDVQLVVEVIEGSDDAREERGANAGTTSEYMYTPTNGTLYDVMTGYRFQNVTVPQGATITRAEFTCTSRSSTTGPAELYVNFEDIASAAQPVIEVNNLHSRNWTATNVPWTAGSWTGGNNYTSPDLSAALQVVINRGDWVSGNAVMLGISGNPPIPANTNRITCASVEADANYIAPSLLIEYTNVPEAPTGLAITSPLSIDDTLISSCAISWTQPTGVDPTIYRLRTGTSGSAPSGALGAEHSFDAAISGTGESRSLDTNECQSFFKNVNTWEGTMYFFLAACSSASVNDCSDNSATTSAIMTAVP